MPSVLYIDTVNTFDSGSQFKLPINPLPPRGMVANQPAKPFQTLQGPGGIQAPKEWHPLIIFPWPDIVKGNTNHDALLAAFESRQYVKTGVDYFIGILPAASIDDGFPFPTTNKYIKIRIVEVKSAENPEDNNMDAVISNMVVSAIWLDAF